jgi:hypothetical protein
LLLMKVAIVQLRTWLYRLHGLAFDLRFGEVTHRNAYVFSFVERRVQIIATSRRIRPSDKSIRGKQTNKYKPRSRGVENTQRSDVPCASGSAAESRGENQLLLSLEGRFPLKEQHKTKNNQ